MKINIKDVLREYKLEKNPTLFISMLISKYKKKNQINFENQ